MAEIIGEYGGITGGGSLATGEALTYGVPTATWDSWNLDTRARYLMQYNATIPDCNVGFVGPSGYTTTCYPAGTTDLQKVAYVSTLAVDSLTGLEGEQIGADVNATVEDTKQTISDIVGTATDIVPVVAILGVLYLFADR